MPRRLPAVSLLLAWLCASGAMLDVVQAFAWARMFAGYARIESILPAAKDTFDPAKPCEICRAVSKARETSNQNTPAARSAATEKIILFFERPVRFVGVAAQRTWPLAPPARVLVRAGDVPVPPPKIVCS
jgi:hypothetical protein